MDDSGVVARVEEGSALGDDVRSKIKAVYGRLRNGDEGAARTVRDLVKHGRAFDSSGIGSPPDEMLGPETEPSGAERVTAYIASLWACCQQRDRTMPAHKNGARLTDQVRALAARDAHLNKPGAEPYLGALMGSTRFEEATGHLTALVKRLAVNGRPIDYGELAADLYEYLQPGGPEAVRMRWAAEIWRPRGSSTGEPDDQFQDGDS